MRKARGGRAEKNQPVGQRNNTHIWVEGVGVTAGGVGEEGGEWGRRRERLRGRRQGEEGLAVLCLLFLGEGGGGALASSSPISRR